MSAASDTTGVYQQPRREANKYSYIFFFFFVLIGSFFILNLIVGVIIESFQNLRKQTESSSAVEAFLTESQKTFYKTMRTMLNRKPKKTIPEPKNPLQLAVFKIVTHSKFEVVVFVVILMNMFTLALEHYKMSYTWVLVLRYVDIGFTTLFSIEAILKLIGTRLYYFRDPFNVFDFVVILLSIVGFILEELLTFVVSPTLLRVVRVFRVFRVLRVVRAARGIRRLILTLMISMPALFNIAVLLAVFMLIFAILGMSFFMNVKLRGALNDLVNFRTFGSSMMLLFRLMTSAGWNDILNPLMDETDCEPQECGKRVIAIVYFVAYIFIVFLVVVNMYIAIILENFDEIFQQEETGVSQDDFEYFYVVWGRYDPKASQFVSVAELSNLLHSLHPPFQLAKPNEIKIAALNLPIVNGDKVHCLDVLFALVKRIMGEVEISDEMRQEAEARLLKSFPNRKTLKAETTTLALRQKVKAAKVIQEAWRGFNGKRKRGIDSSSSDIFGFMSSDTNSPSSSIPAMIGSTMTATLPIASKNPNLSVVCEILKQNNITQEKKASTKSAAKTGSVVYKNKHISVHNDTESCEEKIPEVKSSVAVQNVPDKNEKVIVKSHTYSEIPQIPTSDSKQKDTLTELGNNGFMKRVNSLPNPQQKDRNEPAKKQSTLLKLNEDLIIENAYSDNENSDSNSDHDKKGDVHPTAGKASLQMPQNKDKTSITRSKSTGEVKNIRQNIVSEIKPVTGKQLKFNPHTGKFKAKKQSDHQEEKENSGIANDQSLTMVNEHISTES